MGKNDKPYSTPRTAPKCVKYWDKVFKNKKYYFDWQVMRSVVEAKVPEIIDQLELPAKDARTVAWNAYCAAIEGDEESPIWDEYGDFLDVIEDPDMPEFVMRQVIGSDLHSGCTEKEAKRLFIEWLDEDPEHGDFGDYKITRALKVIRT